MHSSLSTSKRRVGGLVKVQSFLSAMHLMLLQRPTLTKSYATTIKKSEAREV